MKIGNLKRVTAQDIKSNPEMFALLINQNADILEQALNSGLDLESNYKGKFLTVTFEPGVPKLIPNVSAQYVDVKNIVPTSGTIEKPTNWSRPAQGGFELTVWWDGTATSAKVTMFIGVL